MLNLSHVAMSPSANGMRRVVAGSDRSCDRTKVPHDSASCRTVDAWRTGAGQHQYVPAAGSAEPGGEIGFPVRCCLIAAADRRT